MKIDIDHIAKLARLDIGEQEREIFTKHMENMLDLVSNLPPSEEKLALMDPSNPMILRADEILPSTPRADILKNAPQTQAGCVVVPKIME